jgi:TetR/AcrR family transcriptional regulator, transcriptional repressor for nem operon
LRELVRAPLDTSDRVIQFGCPHGSLCQELEKLGKDAPLARAAARLLDVYIEWADSQFRALGCEKREARALATDLVASVQGTMLLANTLRSPALLVAQLRRVERWLDGAGPSRLPSPARPTRPRSRS